MKFINKLGLSLVASLAMVACVDQEPEIQNFPDADVDFTYAVAGEEYVVDYYVVSTIQFNNISEKTGTTTWDFGDGTTSNETNPTHKYEAAGLYNVTLTIDANDGKSYSRTYPLLIYDIVPILTVAEQSDSIIEINATTVSFNLELPNPEDLKVKYTWIFPEGTTFEDPEVAAQVVNNTWVGYGQKVGEEYVIEYPGKVKFSNIGSQRIDIETTFDVDREGAAERPLEPTYYNVQVACNYEAPTLYYAQVDGNIKALKLVNETDPQFVPGTKVSPYDMGVKAGSTPFNICYGSYNQVGADGEAVTQHCIYILDSGKQYYYVNDESDNLGDGKITAMNVDGTGVNTVVSNEGQAAFMDPFQGYVYGSDLYYSDRNNGVSSIPLSTRGAVETQDASDASFRGSYVFENDLIPYYNRGIAYGAISAGMQKDSKGVWWWGKNYSGNGIYRFKDSDIYPTAAAAAAAASPYPIVLSGVKLRTFVIDEARKALYVWRIETTNSGFYHYTLPGDTEEGSLNSPVAKVAMQAAPVNTTADEQVHTTQFALDENSGRVYFCFRAEDGDASGIGTGIVYYDPATGKCQRYGETEDAGYGITINPTLTKLF